ncbi:MAG: CDP-alcohol phosphatidyltransferase family protein [Patescibacteria group bacterium]
MIVFLENFFLNIASKIAKIFLKIGIKPVQVTLLRFLIAAPLSFYFFSKGKYLYNVIGLFLYMAWALLDWVDGRLAKLVKLPKETKPLGKLIDSTLDRILMLIVLGSVFYAGAALTQKQIWVILAIIFYSSLFFLTVLLYEFDRIFGIEYNRYPEIEKEMRKISRKPNTLDSFLINLLCLRSSPYRFCFMISYPLFLGIITNQLILTFIFITFMSNIRAVGIFFIMHQTLKKGETNLLVAKALRKYLRK